MKKEIWLQNLTWEEMRGSVDSSGGTTGEPSKASQQGGKIYHQHLVEKLVEAIEQIQA